MRNYTEEGKVPHTDILNKHNKSTSSEAKFDVDSKLEVFRLAFTTMKFIYFILCLSLLVYSVWGAPRHRTLLAPVTVSDANIPRHLPRPRKTISATPQAKSKQRPGRKPKPLEDRVYKVRGPIRRIERSYSREKKGEVLMFLMHHRVPKDLKFDDDDDVVEYRPPIQMEASRWFKIPQRSMPIGGRTALK
ncbi:hypothetical protein L211DRAFT_299297 [Terfezia boudieri ATCC MYA-4762]|uniref:Transmembrane protein n=1 Tax=Terfezia boudieri ATCC MYA-4762 TaxID=1051890 RepID=A0A3N4LNN2_9PEZI|nr:hypothetical protein L211DRAFT_299297 [Terfezia boudieri ATCC MYA-4762]